MEDKVFYVWFDTPMNTLLLGMAGCGKGSDWERGGSQIKGAGRDLPNLWAKITCVCTPVLPSDNLGIRRARKLVDYIKSFNYLNYDGGQFSTSRGRGVFMDQALEILPAGHWRWWLLSNAPKAPDAELQFEANTNKDLADVLEIYPGETVPEGGA